MPIPPVGSVLTLECQGDVNGARFLDGRTRDGTVGLADNTALSGTQWAVTMYAGEVITLKCMGDIQGPRFLNGRPMNGTVGLVPSTKQPDYRGIRWAIAEGNDETVTLRCLDLADGNRYLDGRTMDGTVGLAPDTGSPFSGTHWRIAVLGKVVMVFCVGNNDRANRLLDGRTGEGTVGLAESSHDPYLGTRWLMSGTEKNFTLKCLGAGDGPWYLDGNTVSGRVGLVPHTNPPYSGTSWMIDRTAGRSALMCLGKIKGPCFLDGRTGDGTVALVTDPDPLSGARWRIIEPCSPSQVRVPGGVTTVRVAQLTGDNDPEDRPILNKTLDWGVQGLDLGANCVHYDGKIYIYLSDVVPTWGQSEIVPNSDLVAQLAAPALGGHEPEGFDFSLPFQLSTSPGRPGWCYCRNCAALFFNGSLDKGVCPAAEDGHVAGDGKFAIPFEQMGAAGQREWRRCIKCQVMFFEFFADRGVCAGGGRHIAGVGKYVLPHDGQAAEGSHQVNWRFCKWCRGLFFAGFPYQHGACIAGGGAFHLEPVRYHGIFFGLFFDAFKVSGLIGETLRDETPTGAFSYDGKMYVFIWVGERKNQHPPPRQGAYLVSKDNPGVVGPYEEKFLLSDFQAGEGWFQQVAPWVVKNADVPGLPHSEGDGLLMFGQGWHADQVDAVHLAWMPLRSLQEAQQLGGQAGPQFDKIQYRRAENRGRKPWTTDRAKAKALFTMPSHYTSISVAWLEGPKRWILLYSKACGDQMSPHYNPAESVVARIGKTPWNLSEEVEIFNPCREQAYGSYMHWQGLDTIFPDVLPSAPLDDQPGWSYGAFLLNRFTKWHPGTRMLDIYYLLSLARPYQTQVMFTKMYVPEG